MVRRTRLLRMLRAARDLRLVSVVAPPGYGKTNVVAQWAAAADRAVAWWTADDGDNDPVTMLSYLAAALDRIQPVDPTAFSSLASPSVSARVVVGRLLSALTASRAPVLVVIDDIHRITERECLDALAEFIGHLPDECVVALAGREAPGLPYARWRTEDWLLEFGPEALAMDDHEAAALTRQLGIRLPTAEVERLVRRTEGWPALLALAARSGGRLAPSALASGAPVESTIADYLRSELLEPRTADELRFLTRTSILERLTGPLCDAVVGTRGSQATLVELARSTLLVDEYGTGYRYHSLLREVLEDDLATREPGLVLDLHRRAAAWFEANGDLESAVSHAFAAHDTDLAAVVVGRAMVRNHWSGRRATTRAWLERFDDDAFLGRPWLAVLAAWETMSSGDPVCTERFANLAERGSFTGTPPDGSASFESGRAILRACMARSGADDAVRNATRAVELEPPGSPWRDMALWMLAIARLMRGDADGADRKLAEAVAAAYAAWSPALSYCLLGHRSLLAIDQGDWAAAGSFMEEARTLGVAGLVDGYLSSVGARIAEIRLAIHDGETASARQQLARAASLRPILTWNAPGPAVLFLMGLARAHAALGDAAGASTLLSQASGVCRRRPDLGVLPAEVASLRSTIRSHATGSGASTLTTAELRVLSLLPYYLSFKEIAQRLGVSESTIKTHAMAIYGKLVATSRSEAVERAVDAGLLDPFVLPARSTSPTAVDAVGRGA